MSILLRFLTIKSILFRVPIYSSKRDKNPKDLTLHRLLLGLFDRPIDVIAERKQRGAASCTERLSGKEGEKAHGSKKIQVKREKIRALDRKREHVPKSRYMYINSVISPGYREVRFVLKFVGKKKRNMKNDRGRV